MVETRFSYLLDVELEFREDFCLGDETIRHEQMNFLSKTPYRKRSYGPTSLTTSPHVMR
jgi:hypothetical protein